MAVDVEELYRRYGPMVVRRCREMLKDEEKAMEAAQDVFVQVLRRFAAKARQEREEHREHEANLSSDAVCVDDTCER